MSKIWIDQSKKASFVLLGAAQTSLIAAITLITVPLPAIQAEFRLSASELALFSASYGLAFGGLLLVGGRLADRVGARRIFVAGMASFGGASLVGALASGYPVVLGARFAQGVGAALVAPAAVALVSRLYPDGPTRARAFATWGTLSVSGAIAGSLVSGVISAATSWRATFLFPVAVAAITLAGATRLPSVGPGTSSRIGVVDGALATAGLVVLSHGVLTSAPAMVAAGGAILVVFLVRQVRSADPLLPIALVADPARGAALLVIWLTAAASASGTFLLSLYFQQIQGMTPVATSAAFLPFLLIIIMGPLSGRFVQRFGTRQVTVAGLLLGATSMALLSRMDVGSSYAGTVLAGLLIFPIGAGLAFAGATVTALTLVPAERSGVAGGLVNTAMEVGPTIGLALVLAIASARADALISDGLSQPHAITGGYSSALSATAAAFLVTAAIVRFTFRKEEE